MKGPTKVLMVATSHAVMGDSGAPTGAWLEELSTPYYAFLDADCEVEIASIKGGPIPFDPHSHSAESNVSASARRFLRDPAAMLKVEQSVPIKQVNAAHIDVLLLPGGHGTMWDFPNNRVLGALVTAVWETGGVLAAVCHGPAGLVNAVDGRGIHIVKGRRVSAFTDSEERASGLDGVVPFLLETRLRSQGAQFVGGPDFQPFAVRDGRLVTGQNPASAQHLSELVFEALVQPGKGDGAMHRAVLQ